MARRTAAFGGAGILTVAVLVASCSDEPSPPPQAPVDASPADAAIPDAGPRDFAVRGTAAGVLGPVELELRVGGDVEALTVTQDGMFAFEARLEDGTPYTVVLADPDVPCILLRQDSVIVGEDAAIELTCTGPSLASVAVSGIAPNVTLMPGTTEYVVDLPVSQPSVTLTAVVATAGDELAIAGTPVASGAPSAEIPLSLGDNVVDIVVENAVSWQRTYRLTLRRAHQIAQYAYGKASNTASGDYFGWSVALSGETLAVGAIYQGDVGAVYVFRRSGATWQQEAYLHASNADSGDEFGWSVALSGDTLAVGAPGEGSFSEPAPDSGAVYVFRRTGTTWQQEAYVKASNPGERDRFGESLALSGDTLAVGAPSENSAATGVGGTQDDESAQHSGAVYVFRRTGTSWQQEAYVKASNTGVNDGFGHSVAFSGDTLAIGAAGEASASQGVNGNQEDESAPVSGAVYVFRRTGTSWQQEAYVKASNTGANDAFGHSVALSGDTLVVGADSEDSAAQGVGGDQDDNSAQDSGAVYVFRRTGASWQQEAYLKASNTRADESLGDLFGSSVALSGDTVVVGAFRENGASQGVNGDQDDSSARGSGAAYVFRRTGELWQQEAYVKASNTGQADGFGVSVAITGDSIAIGAYREASSSVGVNGDQDDNFAQDSGAVYIFH